MIFFTSDHHFSHKNISKHTNRPFSFTHEMNDHLITQWNSKVQPNDTVYHLGDFAWRKDTVRSIRYRLNGKIHLVQGNHDKRIRKVEGLFKEINTYKEINVKDTETGDMVFLVLFHYPIESWHRKHYGAIHLHGHIHSRKDYNVGKIVENRLDVGVDLHDFTPLSYTEIKQFLLARGKE